MTFLEFDELDEPIGKVDLEINLYMSKGGLQMEFCQYKREQDGTTYLDLEGTSGIAN